MRKGRIQTSAGSLHQFFVCGEDETSSYFQCLKNSLWLLPSSNTHTAVVAARDWVSSQE